MAGTFSQIYVQVVFSVKRREPLIDPVWEERLYQYITGIVRNKQQKLIAINGMPDHIHLFLGLKPSCCISDLVREIKKHSTDFITENRLTQTPFTWQQGYGAFSYSHSQLDAVAKYILHQKEHHRKQSFQEEYLDFLKKFDIHYDEKFVFD